LQLFTTKLKSTSQKTNSRYKNLNQKFHTFRFSSFAMNLLIASTHKKVTKLSKSLHENYKRLSMTSSIGKSLAIYSD